MELQLPVLAPPGSLLLPLALPGTADHIVAPDVHLQAITRCQGRAGSNLPALDSVTSH